MSYEKLQQLPQNPKKPASDLRRITREKVELIPGMQKLHCSD